MRPRDLRVTVVPRCGAVMKIRLDIPGVPVPQARPRFSTQGGFAKAYKTREQKDAAMHFASVAKNQLRRRGQVTPIPAGTALRVSCWFLMPIPKSCSKKFRARCLCEAVYHVKKPDADNLVKFVKDALNGLAWHDDSQVAVIRGMKVYGAEPRTVVLIETLEG